MRERRRHLRDEIVRRIAGVVPAPGDHLPVHGSARRVRVDGVRQVDLALPVLVPAPRLLPQFVDDAGSDDIPADGGERRRRVRRLRLLHQPGDAQQPVVQILLHHRHAVTGGVRRLHRHQREHGTMGRLEGADQLLRARHRRHEHVVGPQHEHRLVAGVPRGVEHRGPVPVGAVLIEVGDVPLPGQLGDLLDGLCIGRLAVRAQPLHQGWIRPEMILDQGLPARDDDGDVRDARRHELPHGVLDHRHVADRQHLLGDRLRQRQQAGTESRRRNHRPADRRGHRVLPSLETTRRTGRQGTPRRYQRLRARWRQSPRCRRSGAGAPQPGPLPDRSSGSPAR